MTKDNRNDLGRVLKQRRTMIPLTLSKLSAAAGVSPSHLGRIERGDRFPSARILHKIAQPLGFDEGELFVLADYLSSHPTVAEGEPQRNLGRLDPYVNAVLSQEPEETQRAVVVILAVLKSMAKGIADSKEG